MEMKRYLALLFALVVLAAVIPATSARYTCNATPEIGTFTGNAPWTFDSGIDSVGQTGTLCSACGWSNSTKSVVFNLVDVNNNLFDYRHNTNVWSDWVVSSNSTMYYQRYLDCDSVHGVRISDGTCGGYDYFYREPRNPAYCTAGSYGIANANFTGTPLSGPASLYVIFDDTSTNTSTSTVYNWTISPGSGWYTTNTSAQDMTTSFITPGKYTISHGVSNPLS